MSTSIQYINLFTNHPQVPEASSTPLSGESVLNLFLPSRIRIGTTRTHTTRTMEHDVVRFIIRNQLPMLPIIHPCFLYNSSAFLVKCGSGGSTRSRYQSCCAGRQSLLFGGEIRCSGWKVVFDCLAQAAYPRTQQIAIREPNVLCENSRV